MLCVWFCFFSCTLCQMQNEIFGKSISLMSIPPLQIWKGQQCVAESFKAQKMLTVQNHGDMFLCWVIQPCSMYSFVILSVFVACVFVLRNLHIARCRTFELLQVRINGESAWPWNLWVCLDDTGLHRPFGAAGENDRECKNPFKLHQFTLGTIPASRQILQVWKIRNDHWFHMISLCCFHGLERKVRGFCVYETIMVLNWASFHPTLCLNGSCSIEPWLFQPK